MTGSSRGHVLVRGLDQLHLDNAELRARIAALVHARLDEMRRTGLSAAAPNEEDADGEREF